MLDCTAGGGIVDLDRDRLTLIAHASEDRHFPIRELCCIQIVGDAVVGGVLRLEIHMKDLHRILGVAHFDILGNAIILLICFVVFLCHILAQLGNVAFGAQRGAVRQDQTDIPHHKVIVVLRIMHQHVGLIAGVDVNGRSLPLGKVSGVYIISVGFPFAVGAVVKNAQHIRADRRGVLEEGIRLAGFKDKLGLVFDGGSRSSGYLRW